MASTANLFVMALFLLLAISQQALSNANYFHTSYDSLPPKTSPFHHIGGKVLNSPPLPLKKSPHPPLNSQLPPVNPPHPPLKNQLPPLPPKKPPQPFIPQPPLNSPLRPKKPSLPRIPPPNTDLYDWIRGPTKSPKLVNNGRVLNWLNDPPKKSPPPPFYSPMPPLVSIPYIAYDEIPSIPSHTSYDGIPPKTSPNHNIPSYTPNTSNGRYIPGEYDTNEPDPGFRAPISP